MKAEAAKDYQVDERDIFFGLSKRNAMAVQESLPQGINCRFLADCFTFNGF